MASEIEIHEYPLQLGIAYILLGGYILRSLFVAVGLPASVGVILSGFLFSFFAQDDLFFARDELQGLAFFLVLLIAGLEIRFMDLKWHIFVLAGFPATCEIIGIATYSHLAMDFAPQEAFVLGIVLVAMGDGLIIPKMKEFGHLFPGHPLPRLVFTWAPLEASFVLTLFGILTGLSSPAHVREIPVRYNVAANLLRIAATLFAGACIGAAAGWLITRRQQWEIFGRKVFNGSGVEAFLMVLAVALAAFALGGGEVGNEFIPMGVCPGSLFQPELLVIVTGSVFAYVADKHLLHEVEATMGGLWVFGQIVLFSMLGSKTTVGILPSIVVVLPIMGVGMASRLAGVVVGILTTVKARGASRDTVMMDILFCFLCTLPRATIQGALGAVPSKQLFFHHGYGPMHKDVRAFIFTAARLYIISTSVCGMILLNTFGPMILRYTEKVMEAAVDIKADIEAGQQELTIAMPATKDNDNTCASESHKADIEQEFLRESALESEMKMLVGVANKDNITIEHLDSILRKQQHDDPKSDGEERTTPQPQLRRHATYACMTTSEDPPDDVLVSTELHRSQSRVALNDDWLANDGMQCFDAHLVTSWSKKSVGSWMLHPFNGAVSSRVSGAYGDVAALLAPAGSRRGVEGE